jgi:hypothetical protein
MLRRLFAVFFVIVASAQANTTLQFSVSPNGATNFANSSSVVTNGMAWGVVIDTQSNGFQGTGPITYDAFNVSTSGFLTVGGVATDDYYVTTGLSTQTIGAPFFTGGEAGNGAITTTNTVPDVGTVPNLTAGDQFGLVWFSSSTANAGDKYGFLTFPDFTMPGAGAIQNYSGDFAGTDPTRPANLTIASSVPEPSRMMLMMLGAVIPLLRRKRVA